jgi:hypothetical protein
MKKLFFIVILLCMATFGFCQDKNDSIIIKGSSQVCGIDLESPHFPGGDVEVLNFISSNIVIPDSVNTSSLNTRIILKISIDTTGTLTSISVLKGINQSIDNEILRVFSIMPKWIPGVKEGKKVSGTFALPIRIEFNKTDEKK